jgi:excisionase family DNA binding protein
MSPSEAAQEIGCSKQHVRWMINNGKIEAKKIKSKHNQWGYEYEITKKEVDRVKKTTSTRGCPRGATRK